MLEIDEYIQATRILRPDIVIGCADLVHLEAGQNIGSKRKGKMGERTRAWMRGLIAGLGEEKGEGRRATSIWAPILPIEREMQTEYLDGLTEDEAQDAIGGIALYSASSIASIPSPLQLLPRLSLTAPSTPHTILREIALGIDMFTVPFLTATTDAGVALSFGFPAPSSSSQLPLGIDMLLPTHATDLAPLQQGCECDACTNHHRAYIHHLLNAKEMLAWVLLQVHNHHIVDRFFAGVRDSIARDTFARDALAFDKTYEPEIPVGTGQGPRYIFFPFCLSPMS